MDRARHWPRGSNELVSGKPRAVDFRLASQLPALARRQPEAPGCLDQHPTHLEWCVKLEASRTGAMHVLTDRFRKLLKEASVIG